MQSISRNRFQEYENIKISIFEDVSYICAAIHVNRKVTFLWHSSNCRITDLNFNYILSYVSSSSTLVLYIILDSTTVPDI